MRQGNFNVRNVANQRRQVNSFFCQRRNKKQVIRSRCAARPSAVPCVNSAGTPGPRPEQRAYTRRPDRFKSQIRGKKPRWEGVSYCPRHDRRTTETTYGRQKPPATSARPTRGRASKTDGHLGDIAPGGRGPFNQPWKECLSFDLHFSGSAHFGFRQRDR